MSLVLFTDWFIILCGHYLRHISSVQFFLFILVCLLKDETDLTRLHLRATPIVEVVVQVTVTNTKLEWL